MAASGRATDAAAAVGASKVQRCGPSAAGADRIRATTAAEACNMVFFSNGEIGVLPKNT